MHLSSLDNMKAFRSEFLQTLENSPLTIIDLGSMDIAGCYRPVMENPNWRYQGLDLQPGPNVDIVLQRPYAWREIPSRGTDVFISGQAFEHIEFFWITMLEVDRVLKPGGLCCIIAPSGGPEHKYPQDCWRFYPDGFTALARFAGLDPLVCRTQWEPPDYPDGSVDWRDTVFIGRKPRRSPLQALRHAAVRRLRHFTLTLGLANRGPHA